MQVLHAQSYFAGITNLKEDICISLDDEEHVGRSCCSVMAGNMEKARRMIQEAPRCSARYNINQEVLFEFSELSKAVTNIICWNYQG